MTTPRMFNFSAGPGTMPLSVLQEVEQHLLNLPGAGMSILEISHRSSTFDKILSTAQENLRELLQLPDHYKILFLQGGATLQFSMIPMSFLRDSGQPAEYIVTGAWGQKAYKEATREGVAQVAWTGERDGFTRTPGPSELSLGADTSYAHFTSNETIHGVQFREHPDLANVPLFCDMSSDFLSQPIDVKRCALVYAGAQKNVGPAGVTVVLIRDDLIERASLGLHTLLDYRVHAAQNSMHNTPPVFAIYIVMLITGWLLREIGGLEEMGTINARKSRLLYDVIDHSNGFYRGHARTDSRSHMNVTWRLRDEKLEPTFTQQAQEQGFVNLKGHRSVGGLRASIYNAMPVEGVQALSDFMSDFQVQNGG